MDSDLFYYSYFYFLAFGYTVISCINNERFVLLFLREISLIFCHIPLPALPENKNKDANESRHSFPFFYFLPFIVKNTFGDFGVKAN